MNFYAVFLPLPEAVQKAMLVMKLTAFLLLLSLLQVRADSFAQKISLFVNNAPLDKVLLEIQSQSGYDFVVPNDLLSKAGKISLHVSNEELKSVLEKCFTGLPFTYSIEDKTIIVKERQKSLLDNVKRILTLPINISGRVTDSIGEALPGVTIKIKGQTKGTITDNRGNFNITSVPDDAVLVFTMIGFRSREIAASVIPATIVLQSDAAALEQVTVSTGYQEIPQERATGSFTLIDNKTFNRTVSPDFLTRLKGVTNGLLFDNNTGNATGISIRGRATIFSDTSPLIVVDNFPFEGDLNTINPDIIENISILKDAAAASIWGVRAGNGVIVVTTKKGRLNQKPEITVKTDLTLGDKPDLYYQPQLTSSEFIDVEKFLFEKGRYNANFNNSHSVVSPVVAILQKIRLDPSYTTQGNAEIDALRSFDARDQLSEYFYRINTRQHYSLDIKGGSTNQTYYFSGGYDKNLPNERALSDSRITLKGNNTYNFFKDRASLSTDLSFSKSRSENNFANNLPTFLPYEQIADAAGNALPVVMNGGLRASYTDTAGGGKLLDWKYRPLDELRNQYNRNVTGLTDYRLNIGLNVKIIRQLTAVMSYQYYSANSNVESTNDLNSFNTRDRINTFTQINRTTGAVTRSFPMGDIVSKAFISRQSNYGRGQLNFSDIYSGIHAISAIAGYEVREDRSKSNTFFLYGYNPETGASTQILDQVSQYPIYYGGTGRITANSPREFTGLNRSVSWYGNASYTFDNRYIVSGSFRKDQSNLFGVKANQKGVPLWSTGLAWNIDHEDFFNVPWLSALQIKTTYGYNGNVNNSVSAYLTATTSYTNQFTRTQYLEIVNPPNDNLRWERVKNLNSGLYFSTKNERITGSIEYYIKKGLDLISTSPIAPQTGISVFTGNTADTKTNGFDIQINSQNIRGEFNWNTTLIANYAKDKITEYKASIGSNSMIVMATNYDLSPIKDYPINSVFAYSWAGLDAEGNPQGYLNGEVSTDFTRIRNSTDVSQLTFFGSRTPTLFGSIRNTFLYKNLELSFNIVAKFKYYFQRNGLSYLSLYSGNFRQPDYSLRWQAPGDELITDVPSAIYPAVSNRDDFYRNSATLIEKADHIRLQDIQINYTFSNNLLKNLPFKNLNLYAYASNLGIIWRANKKSVDPEVLSGYPSPKMIAFGLRTNF
ncbi:MAG: SusC/RagA family TonB-linked outer membrane protein [Pseudosphingobacterium sp.]|nr:SusC/RagA family TonB-linked outer membrane protein [Pseudosphingobacterium sp.]